MNTKYTVKYRRRREGKTNYHDRIKMLKSGKNILIFRKLARTIVGQIVMFNEKGDIILTSVNSKELEKYGWKGSKNNLPAAYLSGFLLAKKAKDQKGELVVNFGIINPTKGCAKYAFLKGAIDGGLKAIHSPDSFPDESRIKGEHIVAYSKKGDAKEISRTFEEAKKKIESI